MRDRSARARAERGSVLILMPATLLVLVILGAIAVDNAVALLGRRALDNLCTEVVDDAAAASVDRAGFYSTGRIAIDAPSAERIAAELAPHAGAGLRDVHIDVTVDGATVVATATATVDGLFARAVPGVRHSWQVRASARATARVVAG